jgi:hypothetical protein
MTGRDKFDGTVQKALQLSDDEESDRMLANGY